MKFANKSIDYYECPNKFNPGTLAPASLSLFLAGGISNCPNWQAEIIQIFLKNFDLHLIIKSFVVFNPRRKDWNPDLSEDAEVQIKWEYEHLKKADMIIFWFPKETLCPIALFELGKYAENYSKKIFVGVHPDYKRKEDIILQMSLSRPGMKIHT